jgi:hypothetical protein
VASSSSSSNAATEKIVKKDIPMTTDYWRKSTMIEADHAAYHIAGWLLGGVESSISDLEFPIVDNTTIVCFESHLIARLGLPPSKFLFSILNVLWCELVQLSYFAILYECWLSLLIPVYSGTSMVRAGMTSLSSTGSG